MSPIVLKISAVYLAVALFGIASAALLAPKCPSDQCDRFNHFMNTIAR